MKCPNCGFNNMAGSDECESCQADLSSLDGISLPKTKIEKILMQDPLSKLEPKEAVFVFPHTSVLEAVKKMNEIRQGCALVEEASGELKGIITERDILFRWPKEGSADLSKVSVAEIMTPNVEILNEDNNLAYALHQMSVKRRRHVPVLRKGQKPGILSARDILKYLARHLET